METPELNAVTGAFGYTGKYITQRLLDTGKRVRTLTGHPDRPNPFGHRVSIASFNFENPGELARSLEGATALYNTYWIRFPYGDMTYEKAVENSEILLKAAGEAGVRRVVHFSIANASEDSPFPYFKGKGVLEKVIAASGLSYAIIRPTVIFGLEDILINNIAWLIRKFPLFAVPGSGEYRLQPVFVEDVAEMAVDAGRQEGNLVIDAVGPETYTFNELTRLIAAKVGSSTRMIHLKPELALYLAKIVGHIVNDVVLTEDEIHGLMANLLVCSGPPTGRTRLSEWLFRNALTVGARYTSELNRHYR
jgi:NADH dehydrogenase